MHASTSTVPLGPDIELDPASDLTAYVAGLEEWLASGPDALAAVARPIRSYADRVEAMQALMAALHDHGWGRFGWPEAAGGLGGTMAHRAAMWETLARFGVPSMALFEHLEVLGPTLVELGPPEVVADLFPAFLRGEKLWSQGFSEPEAGSDLASLRTRAERTDEGFRLNGRKIWTSWARYASTCLVLARTGTTESRHRGLTALVVDLDQPGVEVRPIAQANGTDELAEVTFDDVLVPLGNVVGELDGGWRVAMHILSHERGTFAWFRHLFLYQLLAEIAPEAPASLDAALGDALLDLAAVTAAGQAAVQAHSAGQPLGPMAAFTKLLLCNAERSVNDWVLAADPDIAIDLISDEAAVRREEYLFSRIVTVYGGSQQMQLETIAKQILRLP